MDDDLSTDWVLNPSSEFEAVLIQVVQMHREKTKAYGSASDPLQNFYDIAEAEGVTPLQVSRFLGAKHRQVKRRFIDGEKSRSSYTDDAFLDTAVYAVIDLALYRRNL